MKSFPIYFGLALAGHALALFAIPIPSLTGSKRSPNSPLYLAVSLAPVTPAPLAKVVETPTPPKVPSPELETQAQPPVESVAPTVQPIPEETKPRLEEKISKAADSETVPAVESPSLEALVPKPELINTLPPTVPLPRPDPMPGEPQYQTIAEPIYRKRSLAEYPAQARRLRQEGVVWLTLYINSQGGLDRLEVKESSGHPLLDQAAVAAERKSRFQPAYSRGRPVACKVEVPYRFQLK